MYNQGLSIELIAEAQKLTVISVTKSIERVNDYLSKQGEWWFGLAPRYVSAVQLETGICSKEQLHEAIIQNELVLQGERVRCNGRLVPGLGIKAYSDLCNHVGIKFSPYSEIEVLNAIKILEEAGYTIEKL